MQVTWFSTFGFLLFSSVLASAKPFSFGGQRPLKPGQLVAIAPKSKTCEGAPAAVECRTATQAAPFISKSFQTYNISSPAEQAALVSLMAFETDDFKYNKNHFPGVPGQGSMWTPTFIPHNNTYHLPYNSSKHAIAWFQRSLCEVDPSVEKGPCSHCRATKGSSWPLTHGGCVRLWFCGVVFDHPVLVEGAKCSEGGHRRRMGNVYLFLRWDHRGWWQEVVLAACHKRARGLNRLCFLFWVVRYQYGSLHILEIKLKIPEPFNFNVEISSK